VGEKLGLDLLVDQIDHDGALIVADMAIEVSF